MSFDYLGIANAISLTLTSPALYVCIAVSAAWWDKAADMWRKSRTATIWFAFGVLIGFMAAFVDNAYWGAAWSADYVYGQDNKITQWLFQHGVISNVIFRQIGIIVAGYCHIKSKSIFDGSTMASYHNRLLVSFIVGMAIVWGMGQA